MTYPKKEFTHVIHTIYIHTSARSQMEQITQRHDLVNRMQTRMSRSFFFCFFVFFFGEALLFNIKKKREREELNLQSCTYQMPFVSRFSCIAVG